MATMLRDAARAAAWIGLGLLASGPDARAQQASTTTQSGPVAALTPTVSAQLLYSDNATQAANDQRRSDLMMSIAPGLSVQYRGANSTVMGQLQLAVVNYVRNTQPDRLLPSGRVALHSDFAGKGIGLDASMMVDQVRSQFSAPTPAGTSTSNSYTSTRLQVSPFVARQLDANTQLQARLERQQDHTSSNSSDLESRPDTHVNTAVVGLRRRPTRFGYALDARQQEAFSSEQAEPLYTQRLIKGTGLYALMPELQLGLSVGHESSRAQLQRLNSTTRGVLLDWQPGDRTAVHARLEHRSFGKAWMLDASHRMPTSALGITSNREVLPYSSTGGTTAAAGGTVQELLNAMLTSRIPNDTERAKAVSDIIAQRNLPQQLGATRDVYDLNAQLRQATTVRASIMGLRTTLLMSAGQIQSRPLAGDGFSALLGNGNHTREQYLDVLANHRLTPLSTVSVGLRVSRARSSNTLMATDTVTRDIGQRLSVSTLLTPHTQLAWGVKHLQTRDDTSGSSITENVVSAGLEHRF